MIRLRVPVGILVVSNFTEWIQINWFLLRKIPRCGYAESLKYMFGYEMAKRLDNCTFCEIVVGYHMQARVPNQRLLAEIWSQQNLRPKLRCTYVAPRSRELTCFDDCTVKVAVMFSLSMAKCNVHSKKYNDFRQSVWFWLLLVDKLNKKNSSPSSSQKFQIRIAPLFRRVGPVTRCSKGGGVID